MVQVFVCRWAAPDAHIQFLQVRRARAPAIATWQPVMGTVEPGEDAPAAALRELREETGLAPPSLVGFWALEQVPPIYLHTEDAIILAPRFCALAGPDWRPGLNAEHDAYRWIPAGTAASAFIWPSQHISLAEITPQLLSGSSPASKILRLQ
jgi:8-oxo-dGTP pyrophosphatase MutT (NUDIX family)